MSPTVEKRQHAVKRLPDRSAAGEAFNEVLGQVLRLNGSFTTAGEALTRPAGQSLARWVVLAQCRDRPTTVSDIARQLRQARQSVQRIADLLVADGLCSYADNPHHQRAKLLELTPSGRSTLLGIDGAQRRWCDTLGAVIGEGPLRQTAASLRRVIDVVEQADRPGTAPGRPQRAGE
jgi:DNA-binding MarR family transcriptional regulator